MVLTSRESPRQHSASALRALRGRNCLVYGPAGSGKLTLVTGLSSVVHGRAQQFLFDCEIESARVQDLLDQIRERCSQSPHRGGEVIILRAVDRLDSDALREAIRIGLEGRRVAANFAAEYRLIHATARNCAAVIALPEAHELFDTHLTTTGVPRDTRALRGVVMELIEEFSRRHGRRIREVTDSAIEYLRHQNWDGNYRKLHSVLEAAFLVEDSETLTDASFDQMLLRETA